MPKKILRVLGKYVAPPLLFVIMRLIWMTLRKKFHYIAPIGNEQHVVVSWHNELFMSPQIYRKVLKSHKACAIVSRHTDGELIAGVLKRLKVHSLRGSSKKGAKKVLLEAFRSVKNGDDMLITPDGPRGPRHCMSDGAVWLAYKSALPILVISYAADRYWQLNSWDRFVIPKPFAKVDIYLQSVSLEGLDMPAAKEYLYEKMMTNTMK